ncbi:MAG: hypothetical protein K0Q51_1004 [Rickettsiaceae bacterium]|jgi:HPt (histidine-containing phosphotransfer) domain-containing protein|nr:hypothetical protein [Rickettsiaceae bacterium]
MRIPVDLTNFREIAGGDKALEKALFEEFIKSADQYIIALSQESFKGGNENWRETAHAFKGIALNLGALALGELCKNAQEASEESKEFKLNLLNKIKQEYELVRAYIVSVNASSG